MTLSSVRLLAPLLAIVCAAPLAGCGNAVAEAVAGMRPAFLLAEPALLARSPTAAYSISARDRAGRGVQHFTVTIPAQFDPAHPCLLALPAADGASGSVPAPRRLDGPHGCAAVYSEADANDAADADGAASPRALQVGLYTLGRHFPALRFTQENTLVIASPMTPDGGHARPLQPRLREAGRDHADGAPAS